MTTSTLNSEYDNLRQRIIQRMNADKIDDQIFGVVQAAFANAVRQEKVILSRVEQKRLLVQVTKSVLDDMRTAFDKPSKKA